MSEPRTNRTKSLADIQDQYLRLRWNLERQIRQAERKGDTARAIQLAGRGSRIGYAKAKYNTGIRGSRAMEEATKGMTQAEKDIFMSSFGGSMDVKVPVRQYRKNNRR